MVGLIELSSIMLRFPVPVPHPRTMLAGGTDFNDCVHPLARSLVEGLFGFHPDRPSGLVTVSPQFPSSWPNASIVTPDFSLQFSLDAAVALLTVTFTLATPRLMVVLPLRAEAVGGVSVAGLPGDAVWNYTVSPGFGQSVVSVSIYGSAGSPISGAAVSLTSAGQPVAYAPTVSANASAGEVGLVLAPPASLTVLNFSDPQGLFTSTSIVNGTIVGDVSSAASVGHYLVVATVAVAGGDLLQYVQFKLSVSPPPPANPAAPSPSPEAAWSYATFEYNADMTQSTFLRVEHERPVQHTHPCVLSSPVFLPGTYLSPRPQTCGVRIGTDGWSAWTFPWWGSPKPPTPDFVNIPALSIGGGAIKTPQGAQFFLNVSTGSPNIAFASLWDNYAPSVNVSVPPVPGATSVWVLLAGSTNPMQVCSGVVPGRTWHFSLVVIACLKRAISCAY